jgi:hypothetical protein
VVAGAAFASAKNGAKPIPNVLGGRHLHAAVNHQLFLGSDAHKGIQGELLNVSVSIVEG